MITTKKCKRCGGNIRRTGEATGYSTARSLGRPAGAKGRDEFIIFEACVDCGSLESLEVVEPCHICGSATPDVEIHTGDRNYEITGMLDFVPGLKTCLNVCSGCLPELDKKIIALIDEAIDEGAFE